MILTPKQRQELKAKAHHLDAIIWIGDKGLTENVLLEIDQALEHHELIKVKIAAERDDRKLIATEITGKLHCQLVQQIGRIVVLYRKRKEKKKNKKD
ncbi:MAG: ribosome assembly RNA-binding protein YhbY [Gammaproteobacteria bacterium]|nr:MAG: ribosome assembly RNA-binding protein YhbY [Gammaproteobacteria bacterium]UTW41964.1 ribosome assembly RNA-binding protein YhbY [bacterium SCSIO 12844]